MNCLSLILLRGISRGSPTNLASRYSPPEKPNLGKVVVGKRESAKSKKSRIIFSSHHNNHVNCQYTLQGTDHMYQMASQPFSF